MKNFEKNICLLHGQQGKQWLIRLPQLVSMLAINWDLRDLKVMPNLSYNYVLSCKQHNRPAILKIGFDKRAMQREARALHFFAGHGVVQLFEQSVEQGALLLQQVAPGTSLKSLQDEQAISITCTLMKNLHNVSLQTPKEFLHIADWLKILDKDWNIPQIHLTNARLLYKHLLSTTFQACLLHGDLHQANILFDEKMQWLAIDPKGVVGDPVYEVGAFIRNPMPDFLEDKEVKNIINQRITMFAKLLQFDQQRIRDWTYVQAVLAACWAVEDNLDPNYWLKFADCMGY